MSHLAEEYAKSCGVKIGEPILKPHYFPVLEEKYITIHNDKKIQTKEYDYWADVVTLLKEHIGDIKIIQIGAHGEEPIEGVDKHMPTATIKQCSYVLQKSLAHVGIDSVPVHIASALDKPVVGIYSHTYANTCNPLWNKKSKAICIESKRDGQKPSFSLQEPVKMINKIMPEEIAQAVLDVLGIKKTITYKTISKGLNCNIKCVEIIPSKKTDIVSPFIDVRMDIDHNEDVLEYILQRNTAEVTLSNPLSEKFLASGRIKKIIYKSESFNKDFIKLIKKYAIPNALVCTSKQRLPKERHKVFDFLINKSIEADIIQQNKKRFGDHDLNKLKIKSGKKTVCGDQVYETFYDFNGRENIDDFFLDLDWFTVYSDINE
tara:strand:+ start:840 stop:1964 length:1125 start_codon:yes stop_codon:yes gene_type:complete